MNEMLVKDINDIVEVFNGFKVDERKEISKKCTVVGIEAVLKKNNDLYLIDFPTIKKSVILSNSHFNKDDFDLDQLYRDIDYIQKEYITKEILLYIEAMKKLKIQDARLGDYVYIKYSEEKSKEVMDDCYKLVLALDEKFGIEAYVWFSIGYDYCHDEIMTALTFFEEKSSEK